ncbi:phytoene desaturase family protein [Nocardioides sp. GCM10030258]|uniref:phytoene desaturase family protein n=1 Tax=unclassified Nocardioides TaxID=2615069 RepID=UPI00360A3F91
MSRNSGELPMNASPSVIVIGGGHNGLTAGCYLARAGATVTLIEATDKLGGMTSTNPVLPNAPGHRINEGAMDASLIRTSGIIEDLQLSRYGLKQIEMDPVYAALGPNGESLCIFDDPERTAEDIRRFSPADARAFIDMSNELDPLMDIMGPFMNANPMRPFGKRLAGGVLSATRHPRHLAAASRYFTASQAELIDERFTHAMVKAPLAALPCFVPISEDGTGWALIFFAMHHRSGVARFAGGTGAVTDALGRCFAAKGGQVRMSSVVEEILVHRGRAHGVRLVGGEEIYADAVIAANNVKTTLTELLPEGALPEHMRERAQHIPTSSTHASSFKLDMALSGKLTLSAHQENRHDGVDLRRPGLVYGTFEDHVEAWAACARGELPEPLAGVGIIPSAADPSQAPEGQDTFWFWTGIAPSNPKTPWSELEETAAEGAINHASKVIEGLRELEIDRQVMTPPKFAERFRVPDGNVYHVDPIATRFGPMRPAPGFSGFTTPVEGLFLSGGGMHPSAGICGTPGKLAAEVAMKALKLKSGGSSPRRRTGASA